MKNIFLFIVLLSVALYGTLRVDSAFIDGVKAANTYTTSTASTDSLSAIGGANINRLTLDTAVSINRIILGTADSLYTTGIKVDRLYFGQVTGAAASVLSADTIKSLEVIRMGSGAAEPTLDGQIVFDSLEQSFHAFSNGVLGAFPRSIFCQMNVPLCSNTTDETSLLGVDSIHTLDSLPAYFWKKGKYLTFDIAGIYSTKATTPGTMIVRMKLNTTVLCSTIVTLDQNETDQKWDMRGIAICQDTGVTGTFKMMTGFGHCIAGIKHEDPIYTLGTIVNTTVKLAPDMTVEFSTADAANKIRSVQFNINASH